MTIILVTFLFKWLMNINNTVNNNRNISRNSNKINKYNNKSKNSNKKLFPYNLLLHKIIRITLIQKNHNKKLKNFYKTFNNIKSLFKNIRSSNNNNSNRCFCINNKMIFKI